MTCTLRKRYCRLLIPVFILLILASPPAAGNGAAEAAYGAGLYLTNTGNYTQAIDAFDHALALDPSSYKAWNGKADSLNRDGQYALALQASERALAINASYTEGWINRGFILYNLGKYEDELHAYEQAIALDPGNADGWFNRGYALAGMGRYDEAIRCFEKVREINPSYPNLEANRRIAEKNRDATTPFYIRYAPFIAAGCAVTACIAAWVYRKRHNRRR